MVETAALSLVTPSSSLLAVVKPLLPTLILGTVWAAQVAQALLSTSAALGAKEVTVSTNHSI
jgi:hypothetical protein